jgi:hypothetical protein
MTGLWNWSRILQLHLCMDKWVYHVLTSVKNCDYFVVELTILRIYELEIYFGKNGTCFKPNTIINKPLHL